MKALLRICRSAIAALLTPEGRRGWALALMAGGGVGMTLYALLALWLVRGKPAFVFWLGVLAHLSIIIVISGFGALLVKRRFVAKLGDNRELGIDDIVAQGEETP